MTTAAADGKVDAEALELRAKAPAVTRLSRNVLMVLAAGGAGVLFGATMVALDPPKLHEPDERRELYNTTNKPLADGLQTLPARYDQLPPEVPPLGPALPGDLGRAIHNAQQELGDSASVNGIGLQRDPMAEAWREQELRRAERQAQARQSPVFFELSRRAEARTVEEPSVAGPDQQLLASDIEQLILPDLGLIGDQYDRTRSEAFLHRSVDRDTYNAHSLQEPVSPYQVMAGTIIPASLVTGINSDLPGTIIAQVTEPVFDTVTGRHLLIPQGARLIGAYDSLIAFGQERALVVWRRLINPDGSSIVIDNLPASDTQGYAGLEDQVDFHTASLAKGIVLATLLNIGTEITLGDGDELVRALRDGLQGTSSQVAERFVDRLLDVQPTITVRPGWPVRVIVTKDLILRPYQG